MEGDTFFAPAERSPVLILRNEKELIENQKLLTDLFGSLSGFSAVLNSNRQVVFANTELLDLLGIKTLDPIIGLRPGEFLACTNVEVNPSGCGTGEGCRYCGAVSAILESQYKGERVTKEARITSEKDGRMASWDLRVTSSPLKLEEGIFYVLSLQDISNEKRLAALERIFFHDLLNTAGGLNGLLAILKQEMDPEEVRKLIDMSETSSQVILDEILAYRQLRAAERGDIVVKVERLNTLEFIKSAIDRISFHDTGLNKSIVIEEGSLNTDFETDRLLFQRVLINLLKNALEATEVNGVVKASVEENGETLVFKVMNSGVIPEEVKMQIFQRSFSTKGSNRGIGTYSIRLITETYLRGSVSFTSDETDGTVFKAEINRRWL